MKKIWIIWTVALLFTGCSEEEFQPSILDTEEEILTELDQWIMEHYTTPHNIEILYRWDDFESNPEYTLIPPMEDKVIPFLKVVRKVWIDPYMELGGKTFFNALCPKQIMLVGSAGYNSDGTYLLGEAEGGNKITMYNLNYDDPTSLNMLKLYTHNFHHEFIHILHQTVEYPEAFELISAGDYTSSWTSISNPFALGFVSQYAAADPDEDFAEMISYFVHLDAKDWNTYMNASGSTPESRKKLKEKETIILNYMKSVWGIDLYQLREKVTQAMNDVLLGKL